MIKTITYSQQWSEWGNLLMKPTNLAMRGWGCYITSLSMKLCQSPKNVLEQLIDVGGINDGGLMTYDGVEEAFPKVHFKERVYTDNDPDKNRVKMDIDCAVNKVRRYLDLGQATILCVDNVGNDGIPDHAILAYDYILDGDEVIDFKVLDPDCGINRTFTSKYGNLRDNLYGYVGIISPPDSFPDQSKFSRLGGAFWKAAEIADGKHVETYAREILDSFLV